MPWSMNRRSGRKAAAVAFLVALAAPVPAAAGHGSVRLTRVGGHGVRVSTHADVFHASASSTGSPGTGMEPDTARARPAVARSSRLTSLPDRWCGTERSTDDASHSGTDAPRVKVVYAHPSGAPDRFHLYKDLIQQDVALARQAVAGASGARKTIRFDMGTDCPANGARYVDIQVVALPHDAAYYGFDAESASASIWSDLRRSLRIRGRWNVTAFVDGVSPGQADGIASVPLDETPGRANDANRGGQHAMVFGDGSAQFGPRHSRAFLHETLHTLGAVQDGAPHATGLGHCFDGEDVMCYDDGGPTAPGIWPRASCVGAFRIDCGSDDYFAARPARGSYLARHWNLFDSQFMCAVASCDAPSAGASVRAALSKTLGELTSRFRRAGLPGLLRTRALRLRFDAPKAGRLDVRVATSGRTVLAGRRTVARAGRTTVTARLLGAGRALSRATRLALSVHLSFTAAGRGQVARASTLLVRRR